jgi:hypothetical protein
MAAGVASPLPVTERSTRRATLRRNLPVATSTYAANAATLLAQADEVTEITEIRNAKGSNFPQRQWVNHIVSEL